MADMRDVINAMLDGQTTSLADVLAAEDRLRSMFAPQHTTEEYEYHVHVDVYYAGTINGSERLVRVVEAYDRTQPFGLGV